MQLVFSANTYLLSAGLLTTRVIIELRTIEQTCFVVLTFSCGTPDSSGLHGASAWLAAACAWRVSVVYTLIRLLILLTATFSNCGSLRLHLDPLAMLPADISLFSIPCSPATALSSCIAANADRRSSNTPSFETNADVQNSHGAASFGPLILRTADALCSRFDEAVKAGIDLRAIPTVSSFPSNNMD